MTVIAGPRLSPGALRAAEQKAAERKSVRPIAPSNWTDQRISWLKQLWADGLTCSDIAERLGEGATKNSVIGKIGRLNLPHRKNPSVYRGGPKPRGITHKVTRMPGNSGGGEYRRTIRARALAAGPKIAPSPSARAAMKGEAWDALPGSSPVSLIDVKANQCRWPIGESPFLFCGEPVGDGSYCPMHKARGTMAQKEKAR